MPCARKVIEPGTYILVRFGEFSRQVGRGFMTVDTMRSSTLQAGWRRFARLASLLPWRSLYRLLMRECSVVEASFVLMAGFLLAALLGAVRQVLFHAQFGAGSEASAFSAALR